MLRFHSTVQLCDVCVRLEGFDEGTEGPGHKLGLISHVLYGGRESGF
jgi:hypothetical protein